MKVRRLPRLDVAAFPGAHTAPLYHALNEGIFRDHGLEVHLREVRSSREQLAAWDNGELDAVHTAADHFVRGPRPVAGRVVWREPMGELSVHARDDVASRLFSELCWGVDAADSGFALVLRAIVETVLETPVVRAALIEIGGTRQRLEALLSGEVDGVTLHNPFDSVASRVGYPRLGGHLEIAPDLLTSGCFMTADLAVDRSGHAYVDALIASSQELLSRGPSHVTALLVNRGLTADSASAAVEGLFGALGLRADPRPTRSSLQAVADLRRRFVPQWSPDPELIDSLLVG
jgi:hypothetical protein